MANTQNLKRRIKTAQNVSKTTRAMQMIAASKLKKAQQATLASRPYVVKLTEIAKEMSDSVDFLSRESLYFKNSLNERVLYLIIAPDKGLCGGLVSNLIREYLKFKNEQNSLFITIGKKMENIVSSLNKNLIATFPFGGSLPSFEAVLPIKKIIDEYFLTQQVTSVKIITTKFNSIFSQKTDFFNLLPIDLELDKKKEKDDIKIFEPSKQILLGELANRFIEMTLFQSLLESFASEQAARMMAMQNATDNASDIVHTLRLLYNKARQEKITNEILDITSATVALSEN